MATFRKIKSFDSTQIFYRIKRGSKQFLIFVHGLSGNYTGFLNQMRFFEKKGYSTVALDLRGHGKSEIPKNEDFSIDAISKDIDVILRHEGIDKAILIGHCFGAVVCLNFYKFFPKKVKSLIIINSTYKSPLDTTIIKSAKYFKPLFRAFYNLNIYISRRIRKQTNRNINFIKLKKWPNSVLMTASVLVFTNLKTVSSCHRQFLDFDGMQIVKNVNVKTLIIAGKKDKFFPVEVSKRMRRLIRKSSLRVINKGNHLTVLKASDEINNCIYDFLKNVK
jgi:pimeloyl-ACP methyl ester carboxylesterase